MLTLFGILIILLGIITLVAKSIFKNSRLLQWFTPKRSVQTIVLGVVMRIVTGAFFYAEPGTAYAMPKLQKQNLNRF